MSREERMQILKMIETGKITAEEGMKLIEAVETDPETESEAAYRPKTGSQKNFRIKVFEGDLNKPKVNISIPLGLATMASKIIPKKTFAKVSGNDDIGEIDLAEILEAVKQGADGTLLEVDDESDQTKVIIMVD